MPWNPSARLRFGKHTIAVFKRILKQVGSVIAFVLATGFCKSFSLLSKSKSWYTIFQHTHGIDSITILSLFLFKPQASN